MEAIRPTLEDLGAKIGVAGFPFGEYDVLIVYEAPDDVTAASVAMAVAAAGEVRSAKTTRPLSGQEWLSSGRGVPGQLCPAPCRPRSPASVKDSAGHRRVRTDQYCACQHGTSEGDLGNSRTERGRCLACC